MLIIAERINMARKPISEALLSRDQDFFLNEVKQMIEAGADFIDLNTSKLPERELEDMLWLVDLLKENFEVPLAIDSSNPEVIEKALERIGKPGQMINSTTLEPEKYQRLFSLAKERDAYLIVLLMDEKGVPGDAEQRIKNAEKLAQIIEQEKFPREKILIDPLVFTLSTDHKNGLYLLEAVREIKSRFPDFKVICGLSNISYGLPHRSLLNRTFLAMLISCGLDGALIDPLDAQLMATLKASLALAGKDEYCLDYLGAYREGKLVK